MTRALVIEMQVDEVPVMLILTRRIGETLVIGKEVTMTVLGIRGGQVQIGVTAPRSVPVHREEVLERLREEAEPEDTGGGNTAADD